MPGSVRTYELTPELADYICTQLTTLKDGRPRSLRDICREPGMPSITTVTRWVIEDRNGFAEQYARAKAAQGLLEAEQILAIADDPSIDPQHKRIMVDTRKWYLSKVLPKVYGDRVSLEHTIEDRRSGTSPDVFRYVVSRMAATGETLAQAMEYAYKHPQEVRAWNAGELAEEPARLEAIEEGEYDDVTGARDEGGRVRRRLGTSKGEGEADTAGTGADHADGA